LWSDSAITLAWSRGDPKKWKTFVCNSVMQYYHHCGAMKRYLCVFYWTTT
jgi:hypothetical protein